MELIDKDRAAQASFRFGGVVNLVKGDNPCWHSYTYGKIHGKTVRLFYAHDDASGTTGWWAQNLY